MKAILALRLFWARLALAWTRGILAYQHERERSLKARIKALQGRAAG